MPVQACTLDGKPGWQYGSSGKCYVYEAGDTAASGKAKQQAYLQGAAITGGKPEKSTERPATPAELSRLGIKIRTFRGTHKEKSLGMGDVHVPTSIGTSLAQRRARYQKMAEDLPAEIVVRPAFVSGLGLSDGLAIRLDRAPILLKAWSALRKSATFKLIETVTLGEEPLYDLILRKRVIEEEVDTPFRLLKSDAPQRKVTGIVFEPGVVDTQGDYEKPEQIEQACHEFLTKYRLRQAHLGDSHERPMSDEEATLIENYIAPVDMQLGEQAVKKGSWVQTWQLSPQLWDRVEKGELTGFSFGGTGVRKQVASTDFEKTFTTVAKALEPTETKPAMQFSVNYGDDGRIASLTSRRLDAAAG